MYDMVWLIFIFSSQHYYRFYSLATFLLVVCAVLLQMPSHD
jgi:hypothetical protein